MDEREFTETQDSLQIRNGKFMFQYDKTKKTYDLTDLLANGNQEKPVAKDNLLVLNLHFHNETRLSLAFKLHRSCG